MLFLSNEWRCFMARQKKPPPKTLCASAAGICSINKGRTYLVTTGHEQLARTVRMPFGNDEIQEYLFKLRYRSSEQEQREALADLSSHITDILRPPPSAVDEPLQLDFVVTVAAGCL